MHPNTFKCIQTHSNALQSAAHQISFQLWMASSLLADSLEVAVQAFLARALAGGKLRRGRQIVVAGVVLAMGELLVCIVLIELIWKASDVVSAFIN